MRAPKYTGVGLELSGVVGGGYGLGIGLTFDVLKLKYLWIHADAGILADIKPVTVNYVDRKWDEYLGGGIDLPMSGHWCLKFATRVFVPDPTTVPLRYGDWSDRAYRGAWSEFYILTGLGYTFGNR